MADYEFTLPLPPTINTYRACVRNRLITSKKGREYFVKVRQKMDKLGLSGEMIDGRVLIGITIHHSRNIKYDVSNYLKAYEDALVKCGFIVDDYLIEYSSIRKGEKKPCGEIVVSVELIDTDNKR